MHFLNQTKFHYFDQQAGVEKPRNGQRELGRGRPSPQEGSEEIQTFAYLQREAMVLAFGDD
jgi:hypothetical protein